MVGYPFLFWGGIYTWFIFLGIWVNLWLLWIIVLDWEVLVVFGTLFWLNIVLDWEVFVEFGIWFWLNIWSIFGLFMFWLKSGFKILVFAIVFLWLIILLIGILFVNWLLLTIGILLFNIIFGFLIVIG